MSLPTTPSQTAGPYLKIGFSALAIDALAADEVSGERVAIQGRLLDGDGNGVGDGVIETWQANAHGKYASPEDQQDRPIEPGFRGFGIGRPVCPWLSECCQRAPDNSSVNLT